MKKLSILALVIILILALAGLGLAAKPGKMPTKLKVKPFIFDPDNTGIVAAAWVTHQGLPDVGKSAHALFLQKDGPTATVAAAGALVSGVKGLKLKELGFDVRNDGHCGAGAPRFNVVTNAGDTYFFGCASGTKTAINADWSRVRFEDADAVGQLPTTPPWPGFGNVTLGSITIIFDEGTDQGQGFVFLDNIDVNGVLMGKPGNAK